MAADAGRLTALCRAVLRSALLFGMVAACGAAALAKGAAGGDTVGAFPYGAQLAELYHELRLRCGSDTIGSVYVTEERMMRRTIEYDMEKIEQTAAWVNHFARQQNVPVYWMALPTAAGIYGETLPEYAPRANEPAMLQAVAAQLDDSVTAIEVYSWLYAMREAYICYRTDDRLTAYGSFCAYKTVIRKLGFTGIGYDRYRITHLTAEYQGNLAQETGYYRLPADVVDLYTCENGAEYTSITEYDNSGNAKQRESLYQTELLAQEEVLRHSACDVFASATVPMLQVETSVGNGKHLLLLTDDNGLGMVPFLMQHYACVTVINTDLAEAALWEQASAMEPAQILIVCGADTIANGQWQIKS